MTTVQQDVPPRPPLPYATPGTRGGRANWGAILAKVGPLIGLIFVFGLFTVLTTPWHLVRPQGLWHTLTSGTFCNLSNIELIFRQTAVVGIAALGMTLIIIAGGIDLSVGSGIAVICVSIALFMPHTGMTGGQVRGVPPILAAGGAIVVGMLIGAINGGLITRLKLAPFIITLGMMSLLRGVAQELADNTMVYPRGGGFLNGLLQPINPDALWLFTPGVWLMILLAMLVSAMLRYTRFGRYIFAIGSNEQTARLCGVPVERTTLLIYVVAGALFAVAGILQFSYLGMGDPTTAVGMELDIIAAVVIGGASLSGGQGTVLGSLVGALIMTVVANGCSKMGWPNNRQLIVTGVIIVLAVALDRLRHKASVASE
jgi:ribose/xylose/arabinose/galactoside ABC-type transport system permease subunit